MKINSPLISTGSAGSIQSWMSLSLNSWDGQLNNNHSSVFLSRSNAMSSSNVRGNDVLKPTTDVWKTTWKKTTLSDQEESSSQVIPKKEENTTLDIAMELIKKYECWNWPHLTAYRDHAQWTIWCGTPSYKWEVITAEEAYRRFRLEVKARLDRVQIDFPTLNSSQQAALASLRFNCPSVYNRLARTWVTEAKFKSCNSASGKVLNGLVKRRQYERNIYIGNQM